MLLDWSDFAFYRDVDNYPERKATLKREGEGGGGGGGGGGGLDVNLRNLQTQVSHLSMSLFVARLEFAVTLP
jgi:hypothetical protein